jgi:glycosyltransferase involved in cell wall biosynthesis
MANENNLPKQIEISVVVPARNEAGSIRDLLERLLSQTRLPDEIVIVDGGSTDGTGNIIEEFIRAGAPVKLIRETHTLPGHARNIGVARAASEWIAFIDAGTAPSHEWLEMLAREVSMDPAVDAVYGAYEPVTDTFFKECAAIAYVPPPFETEAGVMRHTSIVSALMRRRVWETVGGFPEHLRSAEDLLFIRKVEQAGFHISRAKRAVVRWQIQPGFWPTFRRFVIYARSNVRAGLWREWQLATLVRYGVILAMFLPAIFLGWRWVLIPILIWLGMMGARGIVALRRNRRCYPAGPARNLARLFLLLPILTVVDVASLVGSMNWLVFDMFRLPRNPEVSAR